MKRTVKIVVALALVAAMVASFAGCAKLSYIMNGTIKAIQEVKSGDWEKAALEAAKQREEEMKNDASTIGELEPGTYGGVQFNDLNDVAAFYKEAYDYTKTLTAQYKTDSGTETFYKLLGEDELTVSEILVDGKPNSTIEGLVPSILGGMFKKQVNALPPSKNRNPEYDKDDEGQDFRVSYLTGDDLLAATVKDNGDGTITLTMQPKMTEMSVPGKDSQGHMFSTLGDISATVDGISILSWAEGETKDNVKVTYKSGTAVVTIDVATKEIKEAEYTEMAYVDVTHANITVIRNKSASLTIKYWQKFPCTAEYMKEARNVVPL